MRLRRLSGWTAVAILSTVLVLVAAGAWWAGWSNSFARWALARAVQASAGALEAGEVQGTLVGGLTVPRVVWHDGATRVELTDLAFSWRPEALLAGQLRLSALHAGRVEVVLGHKGEPGPPLTLPGRIGLPLPVGIDDLHVGQLTVRGDGFAAPPIRDLDATLRFAKGAWRVPRLAVRIEGWGALSAEAQMAAQAPFDLSLSARAQPELAAFPQLPALTLDAAGPLAQISVQARLLAPQVPAATSSSGSAPEAPPPWVLAETTVRPLEPAPVRALTLTLDGVEPAAIGLPGPQVKLSGEASLTAGDSQARTWQGQLALRNALPGAFDVARVPVGSFEAAIEWRDSRLTLDSIHLDGDTITGMVRVDTGATQTLFGQTVPVVDARLDLSGLDVSRWHGQAWPTALAGKIELARDHIEVALSDAQHAKVSLTGAARLDKEIVRLSSLRLHTPAGSIEAAGTARWQAPWRADLNGRFDALVPARLAALAGVRLPERVSTLQGLTGDWSLAGELAPALALNSQLKIRSGRFDGEPLQLDWRGKIARDRVSGLALSAALGRLTASASGDAGRRGDRLRIDLRAPALAAIDPALSGSVHIDGDLQVPGFDAAALANAEVALRVEGQQLGYNAIQIERLSASLDGSFASHRLVLAAVAPPLSMAGAPARARLSAQGSLILPGISPAPKRAAGTGTPPQWQWNGSLQSFAATAPIAVTLAAPVPVAVAAGRVSAGPARLSADGARLDLARIAVSDGRFELAGEAQSLPISRWAERFGLLPKSAASFDDVRLGGRWNLAGSSLDDLDGSVALAVTTSKKVDGNANADLRLNQGQLAGHVDLLLPSLAFANQVIGPEWGVSGRLQVAADVTGRLREPLLKGTLAGRDLAMAQRRLGWRLTDGRLDARFDGDRLEVDALRLQSDEGSMTLSGALELQGMQGRFKLLADRLAVPLGPGQRVVVSADTEIVSQAAGWLLRGHVGIDEGLIELRGGEAPSLPDDVVVVDSTAAQTAARVRTKGQTKASGQARRKGQTQTQANGQTQANAQAASAEQGEPEGGLALGADLVIDLGEHLKVRGRGIDARLAGSLTVRGSLPGAPRVTGTVTVRDGSYSAYGQRLEITRGRVVFNGPVDNPVIDLEAMRRGGAVEAGVAVTGTALSPRIRLVSKPDVPDAQKLSWLVLGTGIDDARSGGQTVVLQAAAAQLLGDKGGAPGEGLAKALGLDVLTIRSSSASGFDPNFGATFPGQAGVSGTATTDATQEVVAIGKRLGSRLMATYEQGLRGVWSLLRLQYDLTKRLSLRAQTGTDTAVDLLYSLSFD